MCVPAVSLMIAPVGQYNYSAAEMRGYSATESQPQMYHVTLWLTVLDGRSR